LTKNKKIVKKGGIQNWSENETLIRTYFKATKTGKGETDFTAWLFAPEVNKWKLIASFR
jgi:hypothetical protein